MINKNEINNGVFMKNKKNNRILTEIKKIGFQYNGVGDDGMEYGEYFEFPDLFSLNNQLNNALCRSDRIITLRSVMFSINGRVI